MLLTLRTKSHHCASLSVPVWRMLRQQQSIHTPLPVGKRTLLLPLGHACETTEPQRSPLSPPAACQRAQGQALAETNTKQKPQAVLREVSQTMAEWGMELDTAIMAVRTLTARSDTGHTAQRALPEILVKISGSREQHILSREPTVMRSSPTNLIKR